MKKQYIFSSLSLFFCISNLLYASCTEREPLEELDSLPSPIVSPQSSIEILENQLFSRPHLKTFSEAAAVSRALLKAEVNYLSTTLQKTLKGNIDPNIYLYQIGFQSCMKTILIQITAILKENEPDLKKAIKIKHVINAKQAANKRAENVLRLIDPNGTEGQMLLLDFIMNHLIHPFTKPSDLHHKMMPKQEQKKESRNVWLPPELLKQKKSGQNRGKKKNVTSGKNQKNNTKKSLDNRAELLSKASLPDEAIQNPEPKEELSFSPPLKESVDLTPEEQKISHSADNGIKEPADKLLELLPEDKTVESAVQEPLPSVSPQEETINLEEVDTTPSQYPKNNKKKLNSRQKKASKIETPAAVENVVKKILVTRDSWDAMVKIRKLRDQPLYESEYNNKVPLKDMYNLIRECNGIIAPGGKSNINLIIPSLNPKHTGQGKWHSTSIHRLHSDRALYLPPNTEHWWNRIENLLIEAGIGPETIETM